MPPIIDDECAACITYLKWKLAIAFAESEASKEYKEKDTVLAAKIKNGPKVWYDSFDKLMKELQLFITNEGLAIPYVSPMLSESLSNLCLLLLVRNSIP